MRILRLLRVLRVLRVLKLARYSTGVQLIGRSLKRAVPELTMLFSFVFIITLVYATIMYYVEYSGEDSKFTTIPESAWYVVGR